MQNITWRFGVSLSLGKFWIKIMLKYGFKGQVPPHTLLPLKNCNKSFIKGQITISVTKGMKCYRVFE